MKLRTSLFLGASSLLALPSLHATLIVTNGSMGTTNQNALTVDGGGWYESTTATNWVEGSWANPGSYPATFPTGSGMACLFDGAAANGYIYQSLGTVTAGEIALGLLRVTCDFAEKSDDVTVNGTFDVYSGTMASPAHGTDIAGAGLTNVFSRTMTAADQGLTAASGNSSRQAAKLVGDIDISGLTPGTELWIRVGRPSSGGGDFIIDNVAVSVIETPPESMLWDINGSTAGAGGEFPDGDWDGSATNWTTTADGTGTTTAWTEGKPAVFAAGADATGAYTVTVSGTRSAASLDVEEGSVLLSGGQIDLVAPAALSAAAGGELIVSSILGGSVGLTTSGAGYTVLEGPNSYSGTTTLGGTVELNGGSAVPDTSPVVVSGSVTLLANETLGDLSGAGSISLGGNTLSVGTATATSSFGGGFTGAGSLIKQGSGTLVLTGGSSTGGEVSVNEGSLSAQGPAADGVFPNAASVTINNGGTLVSGSNGLFGYNNHPVPVTVNAGGVLTVNGGANGGPNIYGTLTLAGGTVAEDDSIHPTYGSYNFGGASITATGAVTSTLGARDFQLRNAATTVQVDADSTLDVTGYFTGLAHATDKTLNKTGSGKLILASATASSHGPTNVNEGAMELNGVHGSGAITVAAAATLTGTGAATGDVIIDSGAILAPGGAAADTIATGPTTINGTYQCQIDGAACDLLTVTGNLTFDPASTIAINTLGGGATESAYVIATYTGTLSGTPLVTGIPSGYELDLDTPNQVRIVKPTGYSTWADANAGGQAADLDHDGDGVSNGIEYLMGETGSTFTAGPSVTGLTVSWTKGGSYTGTYGTDYHVETSSTLEAGGWTPVLVSDPNLNNGSPLQYTLPSGQTRIFARLVVTGP